MLIFLNSYIFQNLSICLPKCSFITTSVSIEIALNSGIDIDSTIRYKSESQKVKLSVAESIKEQILKTNNTSVKSLLKIKRR